MPFSGILAAGIGGVGSILGGLFGASGAEKAAQIQAQEADKALQFQEQQYATQQANQAPFVAAGQKSIQQISDAIANGTFGPGSIAAFQAPTLDQAQQTPGFQFTQEQGNRGILAGAAAGGGISGGTLKALSQYNTNLANTTYGDVFNRALSTYQAQLAGQAQGFNQLAATAGIGQTATQGIGQTGTAAAGQIGNTLGSLGQSLASGVVGSTNALTGTLSNLSNIGQQAAIYRALYGGQGGSNAGFSPGVIGQPGTSGSTFGGLDPSWTALPGWGG